MIKAYFGTVFFFEIYNYLGFIGNNQQISKVTRPRFKSLVGVSPFYIIRNFFITNLFPDIHFLLVEFSKATSFIYSQQLML